MHQVPYFEAVSLGVLVEGLGMLIWLVGHQVVVLSAVKDAMVVMTL